MRRTRNILGNIFGTSLAVGAIASLLLTSSARFRVGEAQSQPATPAAASMNKSLPLEHLIGIAQFVKNPTDYKLAHGEKIAQVTSVSLEGDRMTISYAGLEASDGKTGELVGTLDSNGIFKGVFQTLQNSGSSQAGAIFAFSANGTATATNSEIAATETATTQIIL